VNKNFWFSHYLQAKVHNSWKCR